MLKRSLAAISVICLLCSLFACTAEKTQPVTEEPKPKMLSFYDALDREVKIQKGTTRAATLLGSFADIWQLAGGEVCATCDDAWEDFELDLPDAVNLGKLNEPNVEKLLESEPEIVFASATLASNLELRETLEAADVTVAYFNANSFMEYLNMLAICTKITGREELYKINGMQVKQEVDKLKETFKGKYFEYERRTYLILRASGGYIRAKGSDDTVLGSMLSDLEFANIADGDKEILEELNMESILESNPYRIFIVQTGDDEKATKRNVSNMMNSNPAWYELSAVAEGRVHYMDKNLFHLKPNERWSEAYEVLCKILEN